MITIHDLQSLIDSLNVSHQGVTLSQDNATIEALRYLIDMGLKQSLGDVDSVNRPQIVGRKSDGSVPQNVWKNDRLIREAKRLGVRVEDREALADAWCKDAIESKFDKILSGGLTVSESGSRGDAVMTEIRRLVGNSIILATRKTNATQSKGGQLPIPTGKGLSALVAAKIANMTPEAMAKTRAMAEATVAFDTEGAE